VKFYSGVFQKVIARLAILPAAECTQHPLAFAKRFDALDGGLMLCLAEQVDVVNTHIATVISLFCKNSVPSVQTTVQDRWKHSAIRTVASSIAVALIASGSDGKRG
jgi:hypothetical protein